MTISTAKATRTVVRRSEDQPATRWADANTMTFAGRVFNAELVEGRYGQFLALDIITRTVKDEDDSQVVIHLNSSQLVPFYEAGGIPTGRNVTVTGNMTGMEFSYTNKETGEVMLLKRPRINLGDAFVQWGSKPIAK